jgi:hypothetical protein
MFRGSNGIDLQGHPHFRRGAVPNDRQLVTTVDRHVEDDITGPTGRCLAWKLHRATFEYLEVGVLPAQVNSCMIPRASRFAPGGDRLFLKAAELISQKRGLQELSLDRRRNEDSHMV